VTRPRRSLGSLALLAILTLGCADEGEPFVVDRPTGADEVVIQVGEYRNDNTQRTVTGPTITVYGDGRIIAGGGVSYRTGTFTADQVDALLARADELGLFEPPFERVNPSPSNVPSVDSTVVRFAVNGSVVEQRVVGRIDFEGGFPVEEFIYGLAETARPVATRIWTPELYVRIDRSNGCEVRYDGLATQEERNVAWAILPGTEGVPPDTLPISC
jgi:hypothetical protein